MTTYEDSPKRRGLTVEEQEILRFFRGGENTTLQLFKLLGGLNDNQQKLVLRALEETLSKGRRSQPEAQHPPEPEAMPDMRHRLDDLSPEQLEAVAQFIDEKQFDTDIGERYIWPDQETKARNLRYAFAIAGRLVAEGIIKPQLVVEMQPDEWGRQTDFEIAVHAIADMLNSLGL